MGQEGSERDGRLVGLAPREMDDSEDIECLRLVGLEAYGPAREGQRLVQALEPSHLVRFFGICQRQCPLRLGGGRTSRQAFESNCAALQEQQRSCGGSWARCCWR